jgi:N-acyl-D-amino-acid deacylase
VTTQLTAPDGFGWAGLSPERTREMWEYTRFAVGETEVKPGWPTIDAYLSIFPGNSASNVYPQVPHCALRLAVMGWDPSPASDEQINAMVALAEAWMEAGAAGLCLGLDYQPSANADTRELVALCKAVASRGGIYAAHQRYHTLGRVAAWEETLELSRLAGIPVHVSHERIDDSILAIFERVDREDFDLTFEAYLYPAGMSHLTIMLPVEVQIGPPSEVIENLKKPEVREKSLPHLKEWLGSCNQIMGYTRSGRYTGRRLADLAAEAGAAPEAFAYDLVVEEEGVCTYIFPWQVPNQEADASVARTAVHPRLMIASDGVYNVPHPHPRGFGCFAQVLGQFVRERKLLSAAQAVHKMSGFPARRFGLADRGQIAEGMVADLVVFDPETVGAGATFEEPRKPPTGIDHVLVNGVPAVERGHPTGHMAGRVLKRGR